jgi:hypothetical protein
MKRKHTPATLDHDAVHHAALAADQAAATKDAARAARIVEQFGDGTPYNRRGYVIECRGLVVTTGEALLTLGKRLIVIKEHEPHGEFLDCLREIGIEPRFAQKAMQAALKFGQPNAPSTAHFAGLGQAKLIELLVLDDEEVAELAEGDTVDGVTLDTFDRMSARELRAWARKHKQQSDEDKQLNERQLADKNKKIDEYERRAAHLETLPEAERHQALIEDLWRAVQSLGLPLLRLEQMIAAVQEASVQAEGFNSTLERSAADAIGFLIQQLGDMGVRQEVTPALDERVVPPFIAKVDELIRREYVERARAEKEATQTH